MDDVHSIALHGGAGVRRGRDYSRAIAHLDHLVRQCAEWLAAGEAALDVVERAVLQMEASGLYVAGRGSAPNAAGFVELDASIMDGARRRAGAVAAVRDLVQPVRAARLVMEKTPHVLLSGQGAMDFAREQGLSFVEDPHTYYMLPPGVEPEETQEALTHGTVGAVARGRAGRLAAATSTGGVFGKRAGRVGDTPLIGAGTWADEAVAASCTGVGEYFILAGGAQDLASRVRYLQAPLQVAADGLIADVGKLGGDGGVIAVDRLGRVAFSFNSDGMKRAAAGSAIAPFAAA